MLRGIIYRPVVMLRITTGRRELIGVYSAAQHIYIYSAFFLIKLRPPPFGYSVAPKGERNFITKKRA